jgi:hypothetical protein
MLEILDYLLPIFGVITYLVLEERWKKKYDLPLKKHLLIIFGKISVCIIFTLLLLFVFGYLLKATEIQLLPIMAIGIGCSYAVASYVFKPFYLKK